MDEAEKKDLQAAEPETIPVRNRDIPALSAVLAIMQDVVQTERLRLWQRERMTSLSQHLSGMPGGSGEPRGLDADFAMVAELEAEHREKCRQYVHELRQAERIVNRIESRTMRTFVVMRYILNIPNREIIRQLNMTRWGFERARKSIEEAEDMAHVVWRERYILLTPPEKN